MMLNKLIQAYYLLMLKISLKKHGVVCGYEIRGNRVVLKNTGRIEIGSQVTLNSYPGGELYKTGLQTHCKDASIVIKDNCILNGTMIHCRTSIVIGKFCMFGPGVRIVDNDSHKVSKDINERRMPPASSPIVIEDNVWIGMSSLILKGVTIGENSIIAACSVVTKDVPSNVVVAGNPAVVKKKMTL